MIQLVEVYFKNNEKESFFCDILKEKDGILTIEHGNKTTIIDRDDIKYHSIEVKNEPKDSQDNKTVSTKAKKQTAK